MTRRLQTSAPSPSFRKPRCRKRSARKSIDPGAFSGDAGCVTTCQNTEHHMQNRELDFRVFAREACPVIDVQAGTSVFRLGEPGTTMYVILSGRIDMVNGDKVIESLGIDA